MKTRTLIIFTIAVSGMLLSSFVTFPDTDAQIFYSSSYSPTTIPLSDVYSITTKQVKYNIPYDITNGTVGEIIPYCESGSLVIRITSSDSGKLVIDISRNLLDMKYESEDKEFIVLVDGEETSFDETSHAQSREYSVLLPSGSKEIEIIGTFSLSDDITNISCQITHNPPYSQILAPLKQMKNNVNSQEVICQPNLSKIYKFYEQKQFPACVNYDSVSKLTERGWADKHDPVHRNMTKTNTLSEKEITDSSNLFENITTMKPNSMQLFYYPETPHEKSDDPVPKGTDTYRLFMLIRLPEWMGGAADDASAFKAYSAKSIEDSCPVKYWPQYGRQKIESPCWGEQYRIVDGAMYPVASFRASEMAALPHLNLSSDENGILYVEPPRWTKTENGVIGYGKEMSIDEFKEGSEFLAASFAKHNPEFPIIPLEFAGYDLFDISYEQGNVMATYLDFPDSSGRISMHIGKYGSGLTGYSQFDSSYEIWQIGNSTIKIRGTVLDGDNTIIPEYAKTYKVYFKDGFRYGIEGRDLDLIKNEIIRNHFPEYEYNDLVFVESGKE